MKDLDFLPQTFHKAARRQRGRRNLLYALAVVAGLTVAYGTTRPEIRSAQAQPEALRASSSVPGNPLHRSAPQPAARGMPIGLDEPNPPGDGVPLDALLAEINRLMDPTMALRSFTLKWVDGEARPEITIAASPETSSSDCGLQASLRGVATSDDEVDAFFERLSMCPLVTDVRLVQAPDARSAGEAMCAFELTFGIRRSVLAGLSRTREAVGG